MPYGSAGVPGERNAISPARAGTKVRIKGYGAFLAISIGLFLQASAADLQLKFQHLDTSNGLSQSSAGCIVQDKWGFIWIGTQDGLNRFDGYRITVFLQGPQQANALSQSLINAIGSDREGNLWIGTATGLNKLDLEKMRFTNYFHQENNPNSPASNRINAVYEAPSRPGWLWIGTDSGLDRLDMPSGTFTHFCHQDAVADGLSSNQVQTIYQAPSLPQVLWIGTSAGLNRLDMSTGQCRILRHDPKNPHSLSNDSSNAIFESASAPGVLWIGTENGLNRLDLASGLVQTFRHDPDDPGSLSHNGIKAIGEFALDPGLLWIGTDGGGLNRYDRQSGIFQHCLHDNKNPHSIGDNYLICFLEDRDGNAWIGTNNGGVNSCSRYAKAFTLYRSAAEDANSLPSDIVRSFCESALEPNVLWIGMSGGVSRFDRDKNKFSHFRHSQDPKSLSSDLVRVVYEDSRGNLWVGTLDQGLNLLVRGKNRFVHFRHDDQDPFSLSSDNVRVIFEDRSGQLWIGTLGGGLNKFDGKKTFVRYRPDDTDPTSISDDNVWAISQDRPGYLWLGTSAGLNRLDTRSGKFLSYQFRPDDPNGPSARIIYSVLIDHAGTVWAGTAAGGLNHLDGQSGRFTHFTAADGLANNTVYAILEDDQDNLWLSTNSGLSRFDPRTKVFKNFDVRDGLQCNEFNHAASYKGRSGEMFFGGIQGFIAFFPEKIKDNPLVPRVLITDFQLFHKSVAVGQAINNRIILTKPIMETRELTLSHRETFLSFEFTALNFLNPGKNQYAYMMEGLDKKWIWLGEQRSVSFTTLPPGNYLFRVKAANNDGLWNEQGVALALHILPPFWKTWWFYTLCALGLALAAFTIYRRRVSSLERHRKKLEIQVAERTNELKEAMAELERLSLTDSLTQLPNRRNFDLIFAQEWKRCSREDHPLSLLMIDIDFFKLYNDSHGHLLGDECLKQVAAAIQRCTSRAGDFVARLGGEEFVVILSNTHARGACLMAERVRDSVEKLQIAHGSSAVSPAVTISVGVATIVPKRDQDSDTLVLAADQALYQAKERGRNRSALQENAQTET